MRPSITLRLALGMAVLAGGTASAQIVGTGFDRWDANGDGFIARMEFERGLDAGWLGDWDRNDDNQVGRDEIRGIGDADFDTWDANDSDYLDENELSGSLFDTLDLNDDQVIGPAEWLAADRAGWFDH